MLRIAMVSKWHVHADGYAKQVKESGDSVIACVWDEDAARGRAWAEALGAPFVEDYGELLARDDVDAVLIDAPTSMHCALMVQAANAGKHIFTEKCMCLTTTECDEVIRAVEASSIIFTISLPHRCFPRNLFVKRAIDEGLLGDVTLLRIRNAHNGALAGWLPDYWYDPKTAGGGAMIDLGAHPMYLARWLLGAPTRVQSSFTSKMGLPVEDNAVCTFTYDNNAIAVLETSLVSPMTPSLLEVYGTRGVILVEDTTVRIRTHALQSDAPGGWITPKLPPEAQSPLRQFVDSVLYQKPVQFDAYAGRDLTELMEKAYAALAVQL